MRASDIPGDFDHVLYTEEQVASRIREVAAQIDADYAGREILMVGVLNGAVMTMADLCRAMTSHMSMDWMAVSSYGAGTKSSGVVRILDTGLTLSYLVQNLRSRNPNSIEIMAMFRKPEVVTCPLDVKYVGFDIPNEFVVGYGLDYADKYRNLTDVATLAPHVYKS